MWAFLNKMGMAKISGSGVLLQQACNGINGC